MSKSDPAAGSRILLSDTDDLIVSKIKKATVDSIHGITYDLNERPGVANLLHILSCITGQSPQEIAAASASDSNQAFKQKVADAVVSAVRPIREEMVRLEKDREYVERVLSEGEERAQSLAMSTMKDVRAALGLA